MFEDSLAPLHTTKGIHFLYLGSAEQLLAFSALSSYLQCCIPAHQPRLESLLLATTRQMRMLLYTISPVTGQNVRKLVKDGFVIRKPAIIHSRSRARIAAEARSKGRHTGYGGSQAAHNWVATCQVQDT